MIDLGKTFAGASNSTRLEGSFCSTSRIFTSTKKTSSRLTNLTCMQLYRFTANACFIVKTKKSDEASQSEISEEEWSPFWRAFEKETSSMIDESLSKNRLTHVNPCQCASCQVDFTVRKGSLSSLFLSTVTTTTVPSRGALQSVDGLSLVSMIQTL